jgi:hypothetical protein
MALRLRHWIGLTLAGCALVALRLVPPSEMELPVWEAPPQDVVYEQALIADVKLANARLQRIRVAARVIPATLAHEGPLAFGVPDSANAKEAERLRVDAVAEAEAALRGGADVALGLFYVDWREGSYTSGLHRLWFDAEYYFGERDGRAYCVVVIPVAQFQRDGPLRLSGVRNYQGRIGACQAVARYGLPGEAVRGWLERGGAGMASTLTASDRSPFAFSAVLGRRFERRGPLGLGVLGLGPQRSGTRTLAYQQCFAGVREGCARLLLEPGTEASSWYFSGSGNVADLLGTTPLSAVLEMTPLEPADFHVLADLAAEFGEAQVRRWWTADGPTEAAFREAFGVDAGAWYAARVAKLVKVAEPGPGVALSGLLGAVLFVALGSLVGSAWAHRRRVA